MGFGIRRVYDLEYVSKNKSLREDWESIAIDYKRCLPQLTLRILNIVQLMMLKI